MLHEFGRSVGLFLIMFFDRHKNYTFILSGSIKDAYSKTIEKRTEESYFLSYFVSDGAEGIHAV